MPIDNYYVGEQQFLAVLNFKSKSKDRRCEHLLSRRPTAKQQPTLSPQMRAEHCKQCRRRIGGRRKEEGGQMNALAKRVHKHESRVKSVFGAAWNTVRYNGTVLSNTLKKNVGAQRGSTYVTVRFMLKNGVEKVRELCILSVQRGWVP